MIVAVVACAAAASLLSAANETRNVDWPVYRGDQQANQYVPLAQIHAANVHRLQPAWEYRTGDATQRSTMHANPIVVDGTMYVYRGRSHEHHPRPIPGGSSVCSSMASASGSLRSRSTPGQA